MEQGKTQFLSPVSTGRTYVLAAVSVSLAVGGAILLDRFFARDVEVPLLLFAVAISAWYGRVGAALVALVLSV